MNGKDTNIKHVTCKSHTARSDKDIFKVSPSKLTRRELEDLYFSLVENNIQLKKTINAQRDQVKILTTKVQRMTIQKSTLGSQNRDCCANTKAIILEQKESIADLKKANERLSERIRLLNMRLCSAKQFLKCGSAQSISRCVRCCLTSTTSIKNTSLTALNTKGSEANLQPNGASSMYLNKGSSTTGAVEIVSSETEIKATPDESCQQNKCRTVVEELKDKIKNLEKELSQTHEQYSERMLKLDHEIRVLREENLRVRAHQAGSENRLEVREKEAGELLQKLRFTEAQCDDIATQLQIEKSRVCELETQVKASDISAQVAKALETHINTTMAMVLNNSEITNGSVPERDVTKGSDDSGYIESKSQDLANKKDILKTEAIILDQIANIQTQLDSLSNSVKHNPSEENANLIALQNSKLDSNETYDVTGANSSLNNDSFQTSRVKAIEQICHYPSTYRTPDVPMLSEDINNCVNTGDVTGIQQIDKYHSHNIFPMAGSLTVDMPKIPYFEENGGRLKILLNNADNIRSSNPLHDPKLDNGYVSNESSHEKCLIENKTESNHNINDLDTNIEINDTKDILDDLMRKRRGSSLKGPAQVKSNNLSVTYDETKTTVGSTINIANITDTLNKDVNDIGNVIHAHCQDESVEFKINERNMKKNIRYKHKEFDVAPCEENDTEFGRDTNNGNDKNVGIGTDIKNQFVNNDIVKKYSRDTNTSSKKDASAGTYIIEAKPSKNKTAKKTSVEHINDDNHLSKKNVSLIPRPLDTSTPNHQWTYNVAGFADVMRSTSPDNTDHEISSLTDLPHETEDKSPQDYISPGEEKFTSTLTESYAATTTDYGSLSEGELPVTEGFTKKMSYPDIAIKDKTTDPIALSTTSNRMEEALRAVSDELTRCRELLQGQLPAQVIPNLRTEFRFF